MPLRHCGRLAADKGETPVRAATTAPGLRPRGSAGRAPV